jgi:hypothetical protein
MEKLFQESKSLVIIMSLIVIQWVPSICQGNKDSLVSPKNLYPVFSSLPDKMISYNIRDAFKGFNKTELYYSKKYAVRKSILFAIRFELSDEKYNANPPESKKIDNKYYSSLSYGWSGERFWAGNTPSFNYTYDYIDKEIELSIYLRKYYASFLSRQIFFFFDKGIGLETQFYIRNQSKFNGESHVYMISSTRREHYFKGTQVITKVNKIQLSINPTIQFGFIGFFKSIPLSLECSVGIGTKFIILNSMNYSDKLKGSARINIGYTF